jgi:hypothetical protein
VAAAAVITQDASNGAMTEAEVLEDLKNQPQFFSKRVHGKLMSGELPSRNTGAQPASQVPEVQVLKPQLSSSSVPSKRVKIRYGPYTLPSTKTKNVESTMMGVNGMSDNVAVKAKKPCSDCVVLSMVSGLEYADGKDANTDTGSWLHHVVLMNSGPKVRDVMCGMGKAEAVFMDGNERTANQMYDPARNLKTGYPLASQDTFTIINELMNMDPVEKTVWLTVDYEYLEGNHPEFMPVHQLFLSIGPSCSGFNNPYGKSNLSMTGQPLKRVFQESSIPWKSGVNGVILGTGGHLHDGGQTLKVFHNNKLVCDSQATYGGSEKFIQGSSMGGGMSAGGDPSEHISSMKTCKNLGPIRKGDTIRLEADYNFNQHKGMLNKNGQLDEVMGMAGVLLGVPLEQ